MITTRKYKLYTNKKNKKLDRLINISSWIYNHSIALHNRYYKIYGKHLNQDRLQKHITKLKKLKKYKIWNELNSQAIQETTERIEKGYQLFFKAIKKKSKRKVRIPTFKKRIKYKSFTLKQTGYKILEGNRIKIGKHKYRYFKSRDIGGKIKRLTIKRDALGDFWICFTVEVEDFKSNKTKTGKSAGFDFGLKTYLTSSDNESFKSPQHFKKSLKKLGKVQRKFSKKVKGSNNRKKAKKNLARFHRTVANQRIDFHFKLANLLLDKYDNLYFEDLNIESMKKLWGRKISDLGFSNFLIILEFLAKKHGKEVVKIDRFFASSKLCSSCGWKYKDLQLYEREWVCIECGTIHDRDYNASLNILQAGISASSGDDLRLGGSTDSPSIRC